MACQSEVKEGLTYPVPSVDLTKAKLRPEFLTLLQSMLAP